MKTEIYYFSGTGNSLVIARDIVKELGSGEVISISSLLGGGVISTDADALGIVYPVYAFGIPAIVERFISRLKLKEDQYLFTVANYGLMQGAGITRCYRLLKRSGIEPSAGFGIIMPSNYTPFRGVLPEEKQKKIFNTEKEKVRKIAESVKKKEKVRPQTGFFLGRWFLAEPIGALSSRLMKSEDKKFKVTQKCDSCGICAEVCPVDNIDMLDGTPVWKHRCEQCLACFHWCPQGAIEIGKSTAGKKRYRHPDVTLGDMIQKKVAGVPGKRG
jgi:Fe-S-cluster-containing hydrogenase component 2/flavodoxin